MQHRSMLITLCFKNIIMYLLTILPHVCSADYRQNGRDLQSSTLSVPEQVLSSNHCSRSADINRARSRSPSVPPPQRYGHFHFLFIFFVYCFCTVKKLFIPKCEGLFKRTNHFTSLRDHANFPEQDLMKFNSLWQLHFG